VESRKIEEDLKAIEDINQEPLREAEERTEALTSEILTDFLHNELNTLKIAREQPEETKNEALEESPE
jgi:hypothetical protein